MKYLTLVFITLLFSCEHNEISGNEYTIINFNPSEKYPIFDNAKPTELTHAEIIEIEKIIGNRVTKTIANHNSDLTEYYAKFPDRKFPSNLTEYYRQYVPAINQDGEKVVWINFFCGKPNSESWKTNIKNVRDGGNCYFNLKVNLSKNEYYEYRQNGIAGIKNRCTTPCIINGWLSPTYENPRGFSIGFLFAKLDAETRNGSYTSTLALI